MSNYRAHGTTLASNTTGGVQTLIVHVDAVISDLTLDPTNLVTKLTPGVCIPVAFTGTHAESGAVGATTIEVSASAACHILVGGTPVATVNSTYLPANVIVRYACGSTDKVSVLEHTTGGGTLYITPGV